MSVKEIPTNSINYPPIQSQFQSPEELKYRDLIQRTFEEAVKEARCESIPLTQYSEIRVDVYAKGEHKPLILFSHGYGVDARCYHYLLERLADEGYAVAAINHESSAMGKDTDDSTEQLAKLELVQKNNIERVIKEIGNGQLKGIGNPKHIILVGHSLGGIASLLASSTKGVVGAVNLDGGVGNGNVKLTEKNKTPVLTVLGDHAKEGPDLQKFIEQWDIFTKANDMHPIVIPNAIHMDFVFGFSQLDKRNYMAQKTEDAAIQAILHFAKTI